MNGWNYRVGRWEERLTSEAEPIVQYGIFEVYYDNNGKPDGFVPEPYVVGSTKSELLDQLGLMAVCISRRRSALE